MMRNSFMNTTKNPRKIVLKLAYKHLVHNCMMRNSVMNTTNGPLESPCCLYTSI